MKFRITCILLLLLPGVSCAPAQSPGTVILVSANAEWNALKAVITPAPASLGKTPFGEFFLHKLRDREGALREVVFFHGGWGKIDAAGSTQYAITRWNPALLVNIGTAGGFAGRVRKGQIFLAVKTVTYDIYERMGDGSEAIAYYSSEPYAPLLLDPAIKSHVIVSGDQDLDPKKIPGLADRYGAVAADWESSAIAHVAKKNGTKLVIMRGVSDIVDEKGSETYGNIAAFEEACRTVMAALVEKLPLLL